MFEEYSLADSQTLGTGYIINPQRGGDGGSVSLITDDMNMADQESKTTRSDNNNNNRPTSNTTADSSNWNVFASLFRAPSATPIRKVVPKQHSSKKSLGKSVGSGSHNDNTNNDKFEDNVNNLYGNVEFYFDNNYNQSSRRLQNRVLFRQLSEKSPNGINTSSKQLQLQQSNQNKNQPLFTTTQEIDEPVVDFLKDHPSGMTNSRRIALWLMKFKWYYPNKFGGGDYTGSSNDVSALDDKEDTRPSEFFESENAIAALGKSRRNSNDLSNQNDEDVEGQGEKVQTVIIPPSLEMAWAYFEHITLPRFVYEDEEKDTTRGVNCNPNNIPRLEIAESGEKHFKTKLYNPFFTPLSQLGDFGLGIALYFTTLRALMILMIIAGLVCIPNILYFASSGYSNGQQNVHWALKGSSVCTDYEFVPCSNCNEDNFKRAMDRLRIVSTSTNDPNDNLVFALKNNCDGTSQTTVLTNLAATIVIIVGFAIISFFLSKQEVKFDEDVQTAQDYSIAIKNPPKDALHPQEWRDFFSKNFEGAHVTCCTVSVHNDKLIKVLVKRREILRKIQISIPPGTPIEHDVLKKLVDDVTKESRCRIFNGLPEYYAELLKLEMKIKQLLMDEYPVTSVFVTFETETAQRRVLKALTIDEMESNEKRKYFFRENYEALQVFEAPEPSAVRWQDLSHSMFSITLSLIFPFLITISLLVASTFFIKYLRDTYTDDPIYSAFAITGGNILFPRINRVLTSFEKHRREGQKQTSLYLKNAIFRWTNTAILLTLLEPFTSTTMAGSSDLLMSVYSIFFSEIVWVTLFDVLDVMQNLKRHIFAPRAKTQEDMNNCMSGSQVDLADRYTSMTKIVFVTVWYSSLYPACFFLGALALMLALITDKFSLMRSWAPSPKLGTTISKVNRTLFLPLAAIVMAVISSFTWISFNFDNLCAVDGIDSKFIGETPVTAYNDVESVVVVNVTSNSQMYEFCNQNLLERFAFPAVPSLQIINGLNHMSSEQELYSEIYGWSSISFVVIICIAIAYSFGYSLNRKYRASGEVKGISFSSSGASAYVPQAESDTIPFPLICCSVNDLNNDELFEWQSPYHPYIYYDLTEDADSLIKDSNEYISNSAFSKVRFYEPPFI